MQANSFTVTTGNGIARQNVTAAVEGKKVEELDRV
jgi:hypothetical protein